MDEMQSGHEIQSSNLWPWTVTLTLCWHGWVMSSAHCLTEANIWPKFKENPSWDIGERERTRNSGLKPMTCDLDLELEWLTYGFCTSTHWDERLTKVQWKSFKRFRRYGTDKKVLRKDRQTDKGHFYNLHPFRGGGLKRKSLCMSTFLNGQNQWIIFSDKYKTYILLDRYTTNTEQVPIYPKYWHRYAWANIVDTNQMLHCRVYTVCQSSKIL